MTDFSGGENTMRSRSILFVSSLIAVVAVALILAAPTPAQVEKNAKTTATQMEKNAKTTATAAEKDAEATATAAEKKVTSAAKDTTVYKYVGMQACAPCHKGATHGNVWEVWEKSAHAAAFAKLGAENQKNPTCLGCHTTGYDKALVPGVTSAKMENVQCEACHGPGSGYKKMNIMKDRAAALKNGLVLPTKEVCDGCHNGKFPEDHPAHAFNYETAVVKIEHHVKTVEK
jgi:hypothetical protein